MYDNPGVFDIKEITIRVFLLAKDLYYCIGVTLVRSQTEVMEVIQTFSNISLGDEIVYDYNHHNAMDVMTVNT